MEPRNRPAPVGRFRLKRLPGACASDVAGSRSEYRWGTRELLLVRCRSGGSPVNFLVCYASSRFRCGSGWNCIGLRWVPSCYRYRNTIRHDFESGLPIFISQPPRQCCSTNAGSYANTHTNAGFTRTVKTLLKTNLISNGGFTQPRNTVLQARLNLLFCVT